MWNGPAEQAQTSRPISSLGAAAYGGNGVDTAPIGDLQSFCEGHAQALADLSQSVADLEQRLAPFLRAMPPESANKEGGSGGPSQVLAFIGDSSLHIGRISRQIRGLRDRVAV